jgi:transcriptional regulator with XRE-family HTH domain
MRFDLATQEVADTCGGMKFHEKLRNRMKELRLSQERVALHMDVHQTMVGRWTRGQNIPDVNQAFKLAKLLDVPLEDLADDEVESVADTEERKAFMRVVALVKRLGPARSMNRLMLIPDDTESETTDIDFDNPSRKVRKA